MLIKDVFAKRIDRELQGVIVVGQERETNISQELEEYVVTEELQRHFGNFFSAYRKSIEGFTSETGVWISGFFGSGKSHFLKILSCILENKTIGKKKAIEYFVHNHKITDPMVLADMKLAAQTPADAIIFNIDSKSDSSGNHKSAIADVFLKVFNEMQGFCGSLPYLAYLEKKLSDVGKFEEFQRIFREEYGDEWVSVRKDFDFIQDSIVKVLSHIGLMSESAARNWCQKTAEPYKISIEDFAKKVKSYIDKKGGNHHVVFLVDEIGQYISNDTALMLNLQTVAEELGKECAGRAWVVVTSQQDIDCTVNSRENDFSKIQGRFDTRLSLSSSNVDEVIKKRILTKTDTAKQMLEQLYDSKSTILKNLIVFNAAADRKLYESKKSFSEVYPFVPYQFDLLRSILHHMRNHGASGKHLSEGERSMLALFKESASKVKNEEIGVIVPFYGFYDALEGFLDESYRKVIYRAYENEFVNPEHRKSDIFTVDVLKTLLMVKYEREFEADADNITSLMAGSIAEDRISLKGRTEQALRILCDSQFVRKNGNTYLFLTDEEQSINREIEKEPIEEHEVIRKIGEMIFEGILPDKKYRYPSFKGRYTFAFNQSVDDIPYQSVRNGDIGVRILTPLYEGGKDPGILRLRSGQEKEVLVVLPGDTEFLHEIRRYLQINHFLKRNIGNESVNTQTRDGSNKEAQERYGNAVVYLKEALREAAIYVNGDMVKLKAKDITGRMNEALGKLVQTVYHKLHYIDTPMCRKDIVQMLAKTDCKDFTLSEDKAVNPHAVNDVCAYIAQNTKLRTTTSLKALKDRFMQAPYGFVEDDIDWIVAVLFHKGSILFSLNGENISLNHMSAQEIIGYITDKDAAGRLMLVERVRVPDREKRAVRQIMKELFGTSAASDDEDTLMRDFIGCSENLVSRIDSVYLPEYQSHSFPGKQILERGRQLLIDLRQYQSVSAFFSEITKNQEVFLDFAEDFYDIENFFTSKQKNIFASALDSLAVYDDSRIYISNEDLEKTAENIRTIIQRSHPYANIKLLPELLENYRAIYSEVLSAEKSSVIFLIEEMKKRVFAMPDGKSFEDKTKEKCLKQLEELADKAEKCSNIALLHSYADKAKALKWRILQQTAGKDFYIPVQKLLHSASWRIESRNDMDAYLFELKGELEKLLENGKTIHIEF